MLRYRGNILERLKEAGYTQYILKKEGYLGGQDIQKIREGIVLGTIGIDKLCSLLHCQPGTILEWIPDEKKDEETK